MKRGTKEIVIVGGGYVGFHAYRAIMRKAGRQVRNGEIAITLIDPRTSHSFHGWSGETMAGAISNSARLSPFREIFRHARVVRGYATMIDRKNRRVSITTVDSTATTTVSYDHLVIGAGVTDNLDAIPGIREHGVTLRTGGGPEGLRQRVIERLEEAENEPSGDRRHQLLSFVVLGGGFTGVETAAAIIEYLNYLRPRYRTLQRNEERVSLVHAGDELLPEIEKFGALTSYATRSLVKSGVQVRLGLRAASITDRGVMLQDGTCLKSSNVISTVGSQVREIPGGDLWEKDRSGRIVADVFLHLNGSERVWVGGDGASVCRQGETIPTPPNALWAIKHGEWIGKNIVRQLTGRRLLPFTYRGLGQAASLGVGKGIVEFKGMQFRGMAGWVMRLFFFLWFVPSRKVAFQGLVEWMTLGIRGRETGGASSPVLTATKRPIEERFFWSLNAGHRWN